MQLDLSPMQQQCVGRACLSRVAGVPATFLIAQPLAHVLGIEPEEEKVLKHGQLFDLTGVQLDSVLEGQSAIINDHQQKKWKMDTLHLPTIKYGKAKVNWEPNGKDERAERFAVLVQVCERLGAGCDDMAKEIEKALEKKEAHAQHAISALRIRVRGTKDRPIHLGEHPEEDKMALGFKNYWTTAPLPVPIESMKKWHPGSGKGRCSRENQTGTPRILPKTTKCAGGR